MPTCWHPFSFGSEFTEGDLRQRWGRLSSLPRLPLQDRQAGIPRRAGLPHESNTRCRISDVSLREPAFFRGVLLSLDVRLFQNSSKDFTGGTVRNLLGEHNPPEPFVLCHSSSRIFDDGLRRYL